MPDARPFRGWRFAPGPALGERLCPPYDVIGPELAAALRAKTGNAVEVELPSGEGDARYAAASDVWRRWRREGTLRRDPRPAFYLVEERFAHAGKTYVRRGILAGLGVTTKASSLVIPHERTLDKPKADRLRMVETLRANISPIFGVFEDARGSARKALEALAKKSRPAAEAEARGVSYRLFVVDDEAETKRLAALVGPRECLIADGHHRYSVAQEYWRRAKTVESEAVLCLLVPDGDAGLVVLPTHRCASVSLIDRARSLAKLEPARDLASLEKALAAARSHYAFGLCESGGAWLGTPKATSGCRSGLAVEWLGRRLLAQVPPDQLSYTPDATEAARRVAAAGAAVLVKPFTVPQVRKAAKAVGLLPQKSTYFIPKATTGLVFRELSA